MRSGLVSDPRRTHNPRISGVRDAAAVGGVGLAPCAPAGDAATAAGDVPAPGAEPRMTSASMAAMPARRVRVETRIGRIV
jgi:hypothetical protein